MIDEFLLWIISKAFVNSHQSLILCNISITYIFCVRLLFLYQKVSSLKICSLHIGRSGFVLVENKGKQNRMTVKYKRP